MPRKILTYENFCLQCGRKFRSPKSNVIVCSPKCALKRKQERDHSYWAKYYEENKHKILKKNRIWWKDNKSKFHKPAKPPVPPKLPRPALDRLCKACGKPFQTKNALIFYCLSHRYRRFAAGVFTKKCTICGEEYYTRRKKSLFCSRPLCRRYRPTSKKTKS